jgi:hypothetical protein
VVAVMIVVIDEAIDVRFEVAWQVLVLEQDAVLERLMPALDLGLGMTGRSSHMVHAGLPEPLCQITGDVAGAFVAEQPRLVHDAR